MYTYKGPLDVEHLVGNADHVKRLLSWVVSTFFYDEFVARAFPSCCGPKSLALSLSPPHRERKSRYHISAAVSASACVCVLWITYATK